MSYVAAAPPRARPNGWWGMLIFVATEATLFGALLGSYFYLDVLSVNWPQEGMDPTDGLLPLIPAAVLALTSPLMQLASSAGGRGRGRTAVAFVLLALVVQSGYLAFEVHDFRADLAVLAPQENAFASIYYTLVGADHAHVALGLLLSAWLLLRLLGGLTPYRLTGLRAIALYWHVVVAITIVVTCTVVFT